MRIVPVLLGVLLLLVGGCWASESTPGSGAGGKATVSPPSQPEASDDPGPASSGDAQGGDGGDGAEASEPPRAPAQPETVTAKQVQVAFSAHLDAMKKDGDGLLRMFDDRNSEDLVLEFESVLPGARKVEGRGYLVEATFAAQGGEGDRHYDLHFWLNFRTDRDDNAEATALDVTDTRLFRVPKKAGGKWVMEARYDIAAERPVDLE